MDQGTAAAEAPTCRRKKRRLARASRGLLVDGLAFGYLKGASN